MTKETINNKSGQIDIIQQPRVYLVGRQTIEHRDMDKFLADYGMEWNPDSTVAGEILAEAGGRLCYMSFGKGRSTSAEYMDNILSSGHGSVTEHAVWNFIITGVSRSFTHELIRHRAGFGYSQLSQRYVNESNTEFVEPDVIANNPKAHDIWMSSVKHSLDAYKELAQVLREEYSEVESRTLRRKLARQAARSVLPNATETKIFVTANARALRHFIELRGNEHAEIEIRKVATEILTIMKSESPNLFADYEVTSIDDGTEIVATEYRKV